MSTGRWIAIEGGEGSGKSTQAGLLAGALGAVLTREPGGTPVGVHIRALLLEPSAGKLSPRAEALLMAADRAQHVSDVVMPALGSGRNVVSDRSAWSSLAYQGFGRGLELGWLRVLSDWAMGGRWPDLAVLVTVPTEVAARRLVARREAPDRFESEAGSFHARVAEGFEALAAATPERWVVIDGDAGVHEVARRVLAVTRTRLGPSVGSPL